MVNLNELYAQNEVIIYDLKSWDGDMVICITRK